MFKRNDNVNTPNGPGRIITLPIGRDGTIYLVLHPDKRAATYEAKELQLIATPDNLAASPAVANEVS